MLKNKGFTMVELLVVLVIIAILAAISTPALVKNTRRAKAAEAVASMGLIRQSLREFKVNADTFFDVTEDNLQDGVPPVSQIDLTDGTLTSPDNYGLDIDVGIPQYFSNASFIVDALGTSTGPLVDDSGLMTNPDPVDFIIKVDGSKSVQCDSSTTSNCAVKRNEIANYRLEMDNAGRIFVCYEGCNDSSNWQQY